MAFEERRILKYVTVRYAEPKGFNVAHASQIMKDGEVVNETVHRADYTLYDYYRFMEEVSEAQVYASILGWTQELADAEIAARVAEKNEPPPVEPGTGSADDGTARVPTEVTRRQAIQALIDHDKYELVQPAIDAIVDPKERLTMQNEWDNSQTFQRSRPSLISLGAAIGLDAAGLDQLFIYAAKLP